MSRPAGLAPGLLLGSVLLCGCAGLMRPPAGTTPAPQPAPTGELAPVPIAAAQPAAADPQAELQYHVLAGELAVQRGGLAQAAQHYAAAAALSRSAELAERATRIALVARDEALALQSAQRWAALDPKAVPPRELIARQALIRGDLAQLERECAAIIQMHPEGRGEGYREVALLLGSDPARADPMLAIMQRLIEPDRGDAAARHALALLAVRLERYPQATAEAQEAIRLSPDWPDPYLVKAAAEIRLGRYDAAQATVAQILKRKPDNLQIRLSHARLLLEAAQGKRAAAEYQAVLRADAANSEALFALGLLALGTRDYDRAYGHFNTLYEAGNRSDDAAWYLGQIEEQRGNLDQALNWYAQVLEGGRAVAALVRRGSVLYRLKGRAAAQAYLAGLRSDNPELARPLAQAEAEIYYEAGDYPASLAAYDSALTRYPDDLDLIYGRAMVAAELTQIERAEQDLRFILARQPEDARSLNALGYLLSNHSQRYQEALGYIDRALKLTPDDPAVIDSMGWIQYRLGNLQEALKFLEDAFRRNQDPEIAAHLGEVLWRLGSQDKARSVWQEALARDPKHPVLRETVDRLSK